MTRNCCIILAAGLSSRMGCFKPLLPVQGKPAIIHLVDKLLDSGIDLCIIVTGFRAEDIVNTCSGLKRVRFVHNKDYAETGMLESAKIGFSAVPESCQRILLTPADIPLVPASIIRTLLENKASLLFPSFNMRRGHPAAMSYDVMKYLMQYEGSNGLHGAFACMPVKASYIITEDPRVLMDMDTPDDYQKLLAMGERS